MVATTRTNSHRKKHSGHHQKRNKPFYKVYAPYIPLILLVVANVAIGFGWRLPQKRDVLAYATSMSPQAILDSTNTQRTAYQVPPLTLNAKLSSAAQTKANDMATRNYWSHNTPEGHTPWSFITTAGYSYSKAGENLAYGFTEVNGSLGLTQGWMNSAEHKANLINTNYTEVGFGISNAPVYQGQSQETIVVAMYATPYTTPSTTKQVVPEKKATPKSSSLPIPAPAKQSDSIHEVTVTVLNKAGNPEPNVKVTLHSDPMVGYTDSNGVVLFKNVAAGEHTATVETPDGTAETKLQVSAPQEKVSLIVNKSIPANQTSLNNTALITPLNTKKSSQLNTITHGAAPWLTLLLTIISVVGVAYLVIKHSVKIHKLIIKGEKYVLHHALLDVTIINFTLFCYLVSRTVGYIL